MSAPTILKRIAASFTAFLDWVSIDAGGKTVRLRDVINPFQRADFAAVEPGLRRATGLPLATSEEPKQLFWQQRPRGHSKSSDCSLIVAFFLLASDRKRTGVVAARNRDQAAFIRDAVELLVLLNPTLAVVLDVQQNLIRNRVTGTVVEIISADAMSAYGLLPDLIICDELSHWQNEALWGSLFTAFGKKASCLLICAMNAGERGSWQETLFNQVLQDPDWHCSVLPGPVASWITQKMLDQQRRTNPASRFARYWLNQWEAGEDQAVTEEDLAAAQTLAGPTPGGETFRRDFYAVHGLDLGIRRDRSALVTVAVMRGERRIRVCNVQTWRPQNGKDVNLSAVEAAIIKANRDYGGAVYFDPHQCHFLAQRVARTGIVMREMAFTGPNCTAMAEALTNSFRDGIIDLWANSELVNDIRGLSVEDKISGLKLKAISNDQGHCDAAVALAISCVEAANIANRQYRGSMGEVPIPMHVLGNPLRHGVQVHRVKAVAKDRAGWVNQNNEWGIKRLIDRGR